MKLKTLALILFGILGVLTIGVSAALISMTSALHKTSIQLLEAKRSITASLELKSSLLTHAREDLLWQSTGDTKHLVSRRLARESMMQLFDEIRLHAVTEYEHGLIQAAVTSVNAYLEESAPQNASNSPGSGSSIKRQDRFDEAAYSLKQLASLNVEQAEAAYIASAMYDKRGDAVGILMTILVLVMAPLLSLWLKRFLFQPMHNLALAMQSFRQGGNVQAVSSHIDELQKISEAFVEMALEIRKQNETRVRYLAAAAHDLRNPISAIKMSADITVARHEDVIPAEVLKLLQIIQRQATHLNRMIGDLLDTVRSEGGELELNKVPQDFRLIVKECCGLFCNYSQDHRVVVSMGDSPVFVDVDASRMSQVINNLISNAIKYSPYGGEVLIALTMDSNEAVLSVKDAGIGVEAHEQESIFQPFRRSTVTKYTIPGVGLGLFTSKKIVQSHGGRIELISEVGSGSTFIVRLPLASNKAGTLCRDGDS